MSLDGFINVIDAPNTAQQCPKAGLADELHVDIMPVLLGTELRFFDEMDAPEIQLEKLQVVELPGGRMHVRLRIEN